MKKLQADDTTINKVGVHAHCSNRLLVIFKDHDELVWRLLQPERMAMPTKLLESDYKPVLFDRLALLDPNHDRTRGGWSVLAAEGAEGWEQGWTALLTAR